MFVQVHPWAIHFFSFDTISIRYLDFFSIRYRNNILASTAVRRHCTDWYEIWALTDHEIYYIKIELDLRKFSIGPFLETEKGFWVNRTPGGSQCTGLSPTLSWKWPRATLSPSFGPFFERNHSFGVKMVSENVWKTFKSCPLAWNPTGKKQIYMNRRRSYMNRHIFNSFILLFQC